MVLGVVSELAPKAKASHEAPTWQEQPGQRAELAARLAAPEARSEHSELRDWVSWQAGSLGRYSIPGSTRNY